MSWIVNDSYPKVRNFWMLMEYLTMSNPSLNLVVINITLEH